MMVTVLLPGGGGGLRFSDDRRHGGCAAGLAVMAGMLAVVAASARVWLGRRLSLHGGDHRHRLAAQRIVAEQRPTQYRQPEQAERARQQLLRARRQLRQLASFALAEGGVQIIRCHGRDPRESSPESTTRRFTQGSPQTNGAALAGRPVNFRRLSAGQFGIGRLRIRRERRIDLGAAQQIDRHVQRLVVLRVRRNVGLRAGLPPCRRP